MDTSNSKTTMWIVTGLIVIVLIAGLAYAFIQSPKKTVENPVVGTPDTTDTSTTTPVSTPASTTTPVTNKSTYKDGTYTALGNYSSPGGSESIHVTLTLKNEVVTGVTVVSNAVRPESREYQQKFISGINSQVVGKKINALSVHAVSGSSLTPMGFNDAVAKIEAQAKA